MSRVETIKHVEGVRARWLSAHADPTVNPAWANAERDIGLLLQDYDALEAELAELQDAFHDTCQRLCDEQAKSDSLAAALRPLATAAKSWHDFHHKTQIQCNWICEALPAALAVLAEKETSAEQASYLKTRDCEHEWLPTGAYIAERCLKCSAGRAVETKGEQR